jgi:hypothetical protein
MKSYKVRSYIPEKKPKGRRDWQGQRAEPAGGVREPATGAGRVRQELTATARRVDRTQLRALLRYGWHAALPSARAGEHSEAATGPCRSVQLESDFAQAAGSGYAARAQKPRWASTFATLTLFVMLEGGRFLHPATQSPDSPADSTLFPVPHTSSPPAQFR